MNILNDKIHKILVVDDEKDILDALAMTLQSAEQFNCEITTSENSYNALAELKRDDFDLVLSDFRMPLMNGVEFFSKVKDKYPDAIRIMITGYADIELAEEAINKGNIHHFIEKPWNNDELIFIVQHALKDRDEEIAIIED